MTPLVDKSIQKAEIRMPLESKFAEIMAGCTFSEVTQGF
jgi:hypothetical protein